MIGETIKSILEAEQTATTLRDDAHASVNKIEKKAQAEIEKLRNEHAKQLNEKIKNLQNVQSAFNEKTEIPVDKAKVQKAVQHIIANLLRGSA